MPRVSAGRQRPQGGEGGAEKEERGPQWNYFPPPPPRLPEGLGSTEGTGWQAGKIHYAVCRHHLDGNHTAFTQASGMSSKLDSGGSTVAVHSPVRSVAATAGPSGTSTTPAAPSPSRGADPIKSVDQANCASPRSTCGGRMPLRFFPAQRLHRPCDHDLPPTSQSMMPSNPPLPPSRPPGPPVPRGGGEAAAAHASSVREGNT